MKHVIVQIIVVFIITLRGYGPFTYAFVSESRKYDEQLVDLVEVDGYCIINKRRHYSRWGFLLFLKLVFILTSLHSSWLRCLDIIKYRGCPKSSKKDQDYI